MASRQSTNIRVGVWNEVVEGPEPDLICGGGRDKEVSSKAACLLSRR